MAQSQNLFSLSLFIISVCVSVPGRTVHSVSSYSRWLRDNPLQTGGGGTDRGRGEGGWGGLCMDE